MHRTVLARIPSLVVVLAVGVVCSTAQAETITCTSVCNYGPADVIDNLVVKQGGVATLNGTVVTGGIVVEDRGRLVLKNGVEVTGNVQSFGGAQLRVLNAVIGGSVQITNTQRIIVKNSTIEGDLLLQENTAKANTLVTGNSVGGNLQLFMNTFTNRESHVLSNAVFGNLQLVDNQGGTIVVSNNTVESALQCSDNDSLITGDGNNAGDLECADLL